MLSLQQLSLYPFLKLVIALILGMWLASAVDILLSWQWAVAFHFTGIKIHRYVCQGFDARKDLRNMNCLQIWLQSLHPFPLALGVYVPI